MINNFKDTISQNQYEEHKFKSRFKSLSTAVLKHIYFQVSHQLHLRYGYVVEFNKTISTLTCYNSLVMLLDNSVQSKKALFYLSRYIARNNIMTNKTLSILLLAKK